MKNPKKEYTAPTCQYVGQIKISGGCEMVPPEQLQYVYGGITPAPTGVTNRAVT